MGSCPSPASVPHSERTRSTNVPPAAILHGHGETHASPNHGALTTTTYQQTPTRSRDLNAKKKKILSTEFQVGCNQEWASEIQDQVRKNPDILDGVAIKHRPDAAFIIGEITAIPPGVVMRRARLRNAG